MSPGLITPTFSMFIGPATSLAVRIAVPQGEGCRDSRSRLENFAAVLLNVRRAFPSQFFRRWPTSPFPGCLPDASTHFSCGNVPPREPQPRIGCPHARRREAEFPADDVGALDQCHTLVKC